jgi:hypothetical protein
LNNFDYDDNWPTRGLVDITYARQHALSGVRKLTKPTLPKEALERSVVLTDDRCWFLAKRKEKLILYIWSLGSGEGAERSSEPAREFPRYFFSW